jgi:hypothetical protein
MFGAAGKIAAGTAAMIPGAASSSSLPKSVAAESKKKLETNYKYKKTNSI